jgi:Rieske Fe-S protein
MSKQQNGNRRSFFLVGIYGLWGLITGALAIPASLYLLLPPRLRRQSQWVEVGDISNLKPDTPEEMIFKRSRVDGWKVVTERTSAWVVKTGSGEIFALAPGCTHLGCAYHWNSQQKEFVCPCHTSAFSIDGKVLTGPAPRPLDRYEVKVEGTKLLVGEIRTA